MSTTPNTNTVRSPAAQAARLLGCPTSRRWLSALLLTALLFGVSSAGRASARVLSCRADPIVVLSNHTVIHLSATIAGVSANVKHITYTLHVPAGISIKHITYTGGAFKGKEAVAFYADSTGTSYRTETLVASSTGGNSVLVTMHIGGTHAGATGKTNQDITVSVP